MLLTFSWNFDLTKDENVWSCLLGLQTMQIYRSFIDQMAAQRYLAAKTLLDAKRYYMKCICIENIPNP